MICFVLCSVASAFYGLVYFSSVLSLACHTFCRLLYSLYLSHSCGCLLFLFFVDFGIYPFTQDSLEDFPPALWCTGVSLFLWSYSPSLFALIFCFSFVRPHAFGCITSTYNLWMVQSNSRVAITMEPYCTSIVFPCEIHTNLTDKLWRYSLFCFPPCLPSYSSPLMFHSNICDTITPIAACMLYDHRQM